MSKTLKTVISNLNSVKSPVILNRSGVSAIKDRERNAIQANEQAKKILQSYFVYITKTHTNFITSDPIFEINNNKVTIKILYYISGGKMLSVIDFNGQDIMKSNSGDISEIIRIIAKLYDKDISFHLIRIHYPYLNASIFAKYIYHNSVSNNFLHFQNAIRKHVRFDFSTVKQTFATNLPHETSKGTKMIGIKIQISGRLATERVIPRITKKSIVFGSLSKSNYIDYANFTGKNYLGSFTIKVWIGQS